MTRQRESLRHSGTSLKDVGQLNQRVLPDSYQAGTSTRGKCCIVERRTGSTQRLQMPIMLVFISVVGGIAVFGPSGLIHRPVAITVTTVLLQICVRPAVQMDIRSDDQIAIDRFVKESGSPASTSCTNTKNVVT